MAAILWPQIIFICIVLVCVTAGTSAESTAGLFNRDAVEGRPNPSTVRMLYEAPATFDSDVPESLALTMAYHDVSDDDAIAIDSVERFNGHSFRVLPREVQDMRKKDGIYTTAAMDPIDG